MICGCSSSELRLVKCKKTLNNCFIKLFCQQRHVAAAIGARQAQFSAPFTQTHWLGKENGATFAAHKRQRPQDDTMEFPVTAVQAMLMKNGCNAPFIVRVKLTAAQHAPQYDGFWAPPNTIGRLIKLQQLPRKDSPNAARIQSRYCNLRLFLLH